MNYELRTVHYELMIEIYILSALMILGAILAICVRNLVAAVISMGIIGFGLALCFLFLHAPDLAIVQIVVEILSLVILLAAITKTTSKDTGEEMNLLRVFLYLGSIACFAIFLILFTRVSAFLPEFGNPVLRMADYYIASGLDRTGAANLVAAIILNFRAYDTLGEATVLFTAVVGVTLVLRKKGRKT
jgi:multisubunit Na+/H+ antiporter MnhB subunit